VAVEENSVISPQAVVHLEVASVEVVADLADSVVDLSVEVEQAEAGKSIDPFWKKSKKSRI
jgi:hypothetical protein